MDLNEPYQIGYMPFRILEGLKFYYKKLDEIDMTIYLEPNFPIKRDEVLMVIDFLSTLPDTSPARNICHSHPALQLGMESMDSYSDMSNDQLSQSKLRILDFVGHFLTSATNLMVRDKMIEIESTILPLSYSDKIVFLVKRKHYYSKHVGSFPRRFVKEIGEYCDALILENKELVNALSGYDNQTQQANVVVHSDEQTGGITANTVNIYNGGFAANPDGKID